MKPLFIFPRQKSKVSVEGAFDSCSLFQVQFHIQQDPPCVSAGTNFGVGHFKDLLWKGFCFEVFFRPKNQTRYFECNVNAKGDWALYEFESYRYPQPPVRSDKFTLVRFAHHSHSIHFTIHGPFEENHDWHFGYSIVWPEPSGAYQYLALRHAEGKPDFHHPDSFIHELKVDKG